MCVGIISGYRIFFLTHPTFPARTTFPHPLLVLNCVCLSDLAVRAVVWLTLMIFRLWDCNLSWDIHALRAVTLWPLCNFFHWKRGKPCNNGGLLKKAGSEDVVSHSKKPRLWVTKVWHISTCCFVATWTLTLCYADCSAAFDFWFL